MLASPSSSRPSRPSVHSLADKVSSSPSKRIIVVGDMMLDQYVIGDATRTSPEAPVLILKAENEFQRPGGAANVSLNLAALGFEPLTIGLTGRDPAGDALRDRLIDAGLDSRALISSPTRQTTEKTRLIARGQQLIRIDREKILPLTLMESGELISQFDSAFDTGASAIVLSDYGKGVLTQDVIRHIISKAKTRGIPVLVDPHGNDYSKYSGATLATPNRTEASLAVGKPVVSNDDVRWAAKKIIETASFDAMLITLGPDGMLYLEKDGTETLTPSDAIEVFDVTGAGDTVISAFAAALASGLTGSEAVAFSNRAAAVTVSHVGVYAPTLAEIARADNRTLTLSEASKLADTLRATGKKIVFTNGCFDLLHVGHIKILEDAAALGDVLIVGINTDESVRRLKGNDRPLIDEQSRARIIRSLSCVSYVALFDEDTPLELIRAIQPDVLCKGADYQRDEDVVGWDVVQARGGRVVRIKLEEGFSSTNIVKRIQDLARRPQS
ncbi:MAG: D-glycero-beta-D-manno-heptose 1-phosphate adenylyltransferase [Planctomycetota bacterium]